MTMRLSRPLRDACGFTLLEAAIATGLVAVGLVAIAAAVPLAASSIQAGKQLSTATFLATERLEQARGAAWQSGARCVDDLGVSASSAAPPVGTCPGGAITFADETPMAAPHDQYSRTVRIASCAAGGGCSGIVDGGLRQVTVSVTYRPMAGSGLSPDGTVSAATLSMYVARR
jgi:hypothetical protein